MDAYHWGLDNDSYDDIVTYGRLLRHVHIATINTHRPPGVELCDFSSFFAALKEAGYKGRISIEARWDDVGAEAAIAFEALSALVAA